MVALDFIRLYMLGQVGIFLYYLWVSLANLYPAKSHYHVSPLSPGTYALYISVSF